MNTERHPNGLYVLFATEMWERFSFYTMLAMLTLYMKDPTQGFGWSSAEAVSVYSTYQMFVYATPLIGGWLADRIISRRLAITLGGLFMAAGHIMLGFPSEYMLYAALTALIIGNGFFKPNISTLVGNLYPENSHLKDAAFLIFYLGVNIGAFISPIVAETVMQRYGFHVAFTVAAGGMFLALFIFWGFRSLIVERSQGAVFATQAQEDSAIQQVPERQRILALCCIFAMSTVFWMVFWQQGSTLTFWADVNTDWTQAPILLHLVSILTLGTVDPSLGNVSGVISNAINPFWIIVLTFPLIWVWRALDRRGREPSTPTKMAYGMLLSALAFFIMYLAAIFGGNTGQVSPWWLIGAYALLTLGELFLSPMGLALVAKVAPPRMRGLMMGGWFLSIAIGAKLTVIGVYWDLWSHSRFFLLLTLMAFAMAVCLLILLKPLKRWMPGV